MEGVNATRTGKCLSQGEDQGGFHPGWWQILPEILALFWSSQSYAGCTFISSSFYHSLIHSLFLSQKGLQGKKLYTTWVVLCTHRTVILYILQHLDTHSFLIQDCSCHPVWPHPAIRIPPLEPFSRTSAAKGRSPLHSGAASFCFRAAFLNGWCPLSPTGFRPPHLNGAFCQGLWKQQETAQYG